MLHSRPAKAGTPSTGAFTLVEVILAIVIALGILVVLLYFYQQATNLRTQVIQETERISAARLLMDRLTTELRATAPAASTGSGFAGTSNSLQFVKADVPSLAAWTGGALGRSTLPVTDLKRVKYELQVEGGTNVTGLVRSEEPLVTQRSSASADEEFDEFDLMAGPPPVPAIEEIRFLQFRYWAGTNWLDSWNSPGAPQGVEVSLGAESVTNGMDLAEYPGEIFRRVIYLGGVGTNQAFSAVSPSESQPATSSTGEDVP